MNAKSLIVVILVAAAVVAVLVLKPAPTSPAVEPTPVAQPASGVALPRLLNLGAGKCVPCKMMEPIREELKSEYDGALEMDYIDVWEHREAAETYLIRTIPTLIFFASDGRELHRLEGFKTKDQILSQWRSLGYDLKPVQR